METKKAASESGIIMDDFFDLLQQEEFIVRN